jgi:hypothetical protein
VRNASTLITDVARMLAVLTTENWVPDPDRSVARLLASRTSR